MSLLKKMPLVAEPKRKNLWIVHFPSNLGVQEWWLINTQRPKNENGKWCDLSVKVRDVIGPSAAQSFYGMLELYGTKKRWFSKPIFTITMEMLDPTGVVVEKWEIDFKRIKSMDFGDLNMESEDLLDITTIFEVKNARLLF